MVRHRLIAYFACILLVASSAAAAPIITVVPGTQNVGVGDTLSVDVVVTDLWEPLRGFRVVLTFDSTVLSGVSFTYGSEWSSAGGLEFLPIGGAFVTPGSFQVLRTTSETTPVLPNSSGQLTLLRLTFSALAEGLSPLDLYFGSGGPTTELAGPSGTTIGGVTGANGSVCVGECSSVPEPGSLALAAAGLVGVALRRRPGRAA